MSWLNGHLRRALHLLTAWRPALHSSWAFLPLPVPQSPHLYNGLPPSLAVPPSAHPERAKASAQAAAKLGPHQSGADGKVPPPTPSTPSTFTARFLWCRGEHLFLWGSWLPCWDLVPWSTVPGLCLHRRKEGGSGWCGGRSGRGGDLGQEATLHKAAKSRDARWPFPAQAGLCVTRCSCRV